MTAFILYRLKKQKHKTAFEEKRKHLLYPLMPYRCSKYFCQGRRGTVCEALATECWESISFCGVLLFAQ
jgi:hypothetical protein